MPPHLSPDPWPQYTRAILEFSRLAAGDPAPAPPAELICDLTMPIAPDLPRRFASLGLSSPFAVVTPADPMGKPCTPADNLARLARLIRLVPSLGLAGPACRADGRSPDHLHREPGLALPMPKQAAVQLSRDLRQLGLYWFDGRSFWLVPALGSRAETPLPAADPR